MAATALTITSSAMMQIDTNCTNSLAEGKIIKPAYAAVLEEVPEKPVLQDLGEYKITHYCSCPVCCGEWGENRPVDSAGNEIVVTATGEMAVPGTTIAVDPDVIPLGSTVIIDGQEYIAQDVGGAIKGNRIDVYVNSHEEALEKGVVFTNVFKEK